MNKETKETVKEFDCVKMKNDIQAKLYKYIKDMSFQEQKAFMNKVISGELKLRLAAWGEFAPA